MPSVSSEAGMSLVELLLVVCMVSALLSLTVAAMDGMFRATSRASAVDRVMSLMEQGRTTALASGRPVYVVFADASFPEERQWKALALYKEGSDPSAPLLPITPWTTLPGQMRFRPEAGSLLQSPSALDALEILPPGGGGPQILPYLKFNAMGGVDYPPDAASSRLIICWGSGDGTTAATTAGEDVISVSTFTGRCVFNNNRNAMEDEEQGGAGAAAPASEPMQP